MKWEIDRSDIILNQAFAESIYRVIQEGPLFIFDHNQYRLEFWNLLMEDVNTISAFLMSTFL